MVKVVMLHGGGGVERSKGIAFPERKIRGLQYSWSGDHRDDFLPTLSERHCWFLCGPGHGRSRQ